LRVPYAFILALLTALVDFLPLLGTGIILIPWAIVSLLLGEVRLGVGLLVLYAVSSVIRQILEPKLIGDGLGLHPLLSLAAMYSGLRLFGVWGMILAPLAVAGLLSMMDGGSAKLTE
jgi:predicted PurR-regulated permease PerM